MSNSILYKYKCSMKRTKRYAGRGGSTRRLHQKHIAPAPVMRMERTDKARSMFLMGAN